MELQQVHVVVLHDCDDHQLLGTFEDHEDAKREADKRNDRLKRQGRETARCFVLTQTVRPKGSTLKKVER